MKMVDRIEELSKDPDIVSFYDEANLETAKNLLEEHISIDIISKATGLSKEEILSLKNE